MKYDNVFGTLLWKWTCLSMPGGDPSHLITSHAQEDIVSKECLIQLFSNTLWIPQTHEGTMNRQHITLKRYIMICIFGQDEPGWATAFSKSFATHILPWEPAWVRLCKKTESYSVFIRFWRLAEHTFICLSESPS